MNQFISRHKYHLLIFALLIIVACVSGYYSFKISNSKFLISNEIQKPNGQDTDDKKQTTDNENQSPALITNYDLQENTSSSPIANEQFSHLTINPSDYKNILTATSTVYDVMDKLQSQGKFSFKTKEFAGLGYFVEEINGVKQDPKAGKYWIYYVNGQSAQVGISNYILKPNDLIEWKYENTNL